LSATGRQRSGHCQVSRHHRPALARLPGYRDGGGACAGV